MSDSTVYFVAQDLKRRWPELSTSTATLDVASVPATRLHLIENTWVVSTYLRLRAAGHDVEIVDELVADRINVCTDPRVMRSPKVSRSFLVVAVADRRRIHWGDFHLVQSPAMRDDRNCSLIDHWPQPGLEKRDPGRGDEIRTLAYFGYPDNLAAPFRGEPFRAALAARGVELEFREDPARWHDYREVDLCLAVRGLRPYWVASKPSTKLVQAWLCECPALLGPEPSYRYWGSDGVDYFEVSTPEDAVRIVDRLQSDSSLYRRAVATGRGRAREHDEAAVLGQWVSTLDGPVRDAFDAWRSRGAASGVRRRLATGAWRLLEPVDRLLFRARASGTRTLLLKAVGAKG